MSGIGPLEVTLYLTAGAALGTVYFVVLLRAVHLHAAQAAAGRIIPLFVLRIAVAVATFWIIAQQGALPLLLALLGFLIARFVVQRWARSA